MTTLLFIGAFNYGNRKDIYGGQLTACKSLLDSNLFNGINLKTIDVALPVNSKIGIVGRLGLTVKRMWRLVKLMWVNSLDTTWIFTSDGLGFFEKTLFLILCKIGGSKVVIFPRSGYVLNDYENTFYRLNMKLTMRLADKVVVQSTFWLGFYNRMISDENNKFVIIENWIDVKPVKVKMAKSASFVYVGWLTKDKGIEDILFALATLKKAGHHFVFDIIGGGRDSAFFKELVRTLELESFVRWLGVIPKHQVAGYIEKSNVLIHASKVEGYPNAIIEAMNAGCIVVAKSIPSVDAIISHGKNGYLFTSKSNLVSILLKIMDKESLDLNVVIRETATKRLKENNSIESAINNLKKLI